jgi:hypothetical protein
MLHVVELVELATRAGDVEAVELLERLLAQVAAVDQEQDALRSALGDQPLGDVGRSERLARTGCHLDESPRAVVLERGLEVGDRLVLGIAQPRGLLLGRQRLDVVHTCTQRSVAVVTVVLDHVVERFGPMEPEHPACGGFRIEATGEPRLVARRLISEREVPVDQVRLQLLGDARLILDRLPLDASQCRALLLGLDHAHGLAIDEQHVVGWAGVGDQFPYRHPDACVQVDALVVLHHPAGALQHLVDAGACLVLGGDVVVQFGGNHRWQPYEVDPNRAGSGSGL